MPDAFDPFMKPWAGSRRAELVKAYVAVDDGDPLGAGVALVALVFAPPEEQWAFILELIAAAPDDERVLSRIAAGPVEGLLGRFGDLAVPWIEARAASDQRFRRVLRGVWQHTMSDEVWARVCAARDRTDA